jgi:hypothetical protein
LRRAQTRWVSLTSHQFSLCSRFRHWPTS